MLDAYMYEYAEKRTFYYVCILIKTRRYSWMNGATCAISQKIRGHLNCCLILFKTSEHFEHQVEAPTGIGQDIFLHIHILFTMIAFFRNQYKLEGNNVTCYHYHLVLSWFVLNSWNYIWLHVLELVVDWFPFR